MTWIQVGYSYRTNRLVQTVSLWAGAHTGQLADGRNRAHFHSDSTPLQCCGGASGLELFSGVKVHAKADFSNGAFCLGQRVSTHFDITLWGLSYGRSDTMHADAKMSASGAFCSSFLSQKISEYLGPSFTGT